MDNDTVIRKLLVLEDRYQYILEVMDGIANRGGSIKDAINSLSFMGIELEAYSGVSVRRYCIDMQDDLRSATVEGIGNVLITIGKKVIELLTHLAKVLFEAISRLLKWIKSKIHRGKLRINKSTLLETLQSDIATAASRTGSSEKAITTTIEKTLRTPVHDTLGGRGVIKLNRTYVSLKSHYSMYFKESCLSKQEDGRMKIIFKNIDKWIEAGATANKRFRDGCVDLSRSTNAERTEGILNEIQKSIPTDSAVPDGIDQFIKLGSDNHVSIENNNRWKSFYSESKDQHKKITELSAKNPDLIKTNKQLPIEILEAIAENKVDILERNLKNIEGLYREIIRDGMAAITTLNINDHKALDRVIRISGDLKYLILGTYHCSLSANEFIATLDALQHMKSAIVEDIRHYLRAA